MIHRRPSVATLVCLLSATLACGEVTPAAAQPRHPAARKAPASDSGPLIAKSLGNNKAIAEAIRANYTKYDHRIRMRDGVQLYTSVYVPKDASRSYPMLLQRTPYSVSPYGIDNYPDKNNDRALRKFAPSTAALRDGYIFVHQDVRGRMMSEGSFVDVRPINPGGVDESTDAYDTIDWLVKNIPGNNGRVGMWGISYPGFYAAQAAVNAHPALKAVSPQAPVTDWFIGDDFHHNGAFMLADAFGFYSSFGRARPAPTKKMKWGFDYDSGDIYEFFLKLGPIANADKRHLKGKIAFWNDLMAHGDMDGFWQARNPRPHYKKAKPAIMTVGGWFDAEDLFGALETYKAFETQSPGADNTLVMGPWKHGGWARVAGDRHGDVTFGQKTSKFYQDKIELPFFRHHLKGAAAPSKVEAWMFETGTNIWQRYASWPPPGATTAHYYFGADGALTTEAPSATALAFEEYISDPAKPVPYMAGPTTSIDKNYMSADQRFAARRPDVVVYSTAELTQDVRLAGPVEATLWISTSGTDADFIVKLIDVYPADHHDPSPNPKKVRLGGYQQLVRGEVIRGKYRDSFETPSPFVAGQPTLVRLKLPAVNHSFRPGHRIMIQVQSSWFPLVDRNPQRFTNIYTAKENDFRRATHRIYRNNSMPSGVKVTLAPSSRRGE